MEVFIILLLGVALCASVFLNVLLGLSLRKTRARTVGGESYSPTKAGQDVERGNRSKSASRRKIPRKRPADKKGPKPTAETPKENSERQQSEKQTSKRSEKEEKREKNDNSQRSETIKSTIADTISNRSTNISSIGSRVMPVPEQVSPTDAVVTARPYDPLFEAMQRALANQPAIQRTPAEKISEPMNQGEFASGMSAVLKFFVEYTANPSRYTVTTAFPTNHIVNAMPAEMPELPQSFSDTMAEIKRLVVPGLTHWQHPRFLAYFPHGSNFPDILGETLVACLAVVGFSYDSCPALTEMEIVVTNWIGRLLALPQGFLYNNKHPGLSKGGGCVLPSASDGVMSAVLAARDWKIRRVIEKFNLRLNNDRDNHLTKVHDLRHEICSKLVVYASKDAHSCIEKACKMAMVRMRPIQAREENDLGLVGAQLEQAIKCDVEQGLIPMMFHCTLGTTSTAASDHLDTIWPVTRKYKLWLHVDAAYCGGSWSVPQHRGNAKGLEHATSLNINLNKFMAQSAPGALFWTQDRKTFFEAFDICPVYLKPAKDDTIDLRHFGIQLTRTFRSLKMYTVLRTMGVEGVRHYVNKMCDFAAKLEALLSTHPNVLMFGKRNLGLFCFQYTEVNIAAEERNKCTVLLANYINETHELFITRSNVNGNDIIRISMNYRNMTLEILNDVHQTLVKLIDQFAQLRQRKERISPGARPIYKVPGRNTRLGRWVTDIDLEGTPLEEVDRDKVLKWAETPLPVTEQESLSARARKYHLPNTPMVTECLENKKQQEAEKAAKAAKKAVELLNSEVSVGSPKIKPKLAPIPMSEDDITQRNVSPNPAPSETKKNAK